jgi:glycosyltransferase involved in cell wall biosynthesis
MKKRLISNLNPNVIVPSNWMKTKVEESDTDIREIKYIPHGIDTNLFSPRKREQSRRRFSIPSNSTVLLFVSSGLSNPVKGMKYLIAALNQVESENISLLAIGNNKLPENELSTKFDLHTPGYIENNDLPAAYTAADITIIPSLYESFGLVATESMACETPVIAYKTSGLQEQITDSTGWLAEFKSVRSLSEKIQEAMENKQQYKRKGKKARKRILNKYTQDRFIRDHKEIYKEELDSI